MKFIHIADMHFDSPFTGLSNINNFGDIRRLEQRKIFRKVIEYIKENNIDFLLIAGDLYEHEYVKKSTIEYINDLFKEIEKTKIIIVSGNHDPYIKESYYETYEWNENVYICSKKFDMLSVNDIDFYMTGFTDFYMEESQINNIKILDKSKTNVLLTHCDLNGTRDKNGYSYNPILESKINSLGFDYIAMGHIHKMYINEKGNCIYPGSPISFGFDELGEHGMIVGEIINSELKTKFIKLDDRLFTKYELIVDNIMTQEELIEKIEKLDLNINNMYEIILVGNREFEIKIRDIFKLINVENILKIKDKTELRYNIEEISKESSLRGIFVRKLIEEYNLGMYNEEQIKKAIEIGLNAM